MGGCIGTTMEGWGVRECAGKRGSRFCMLMDVRGASKDYAISIATIHHLATRERRKLAVQVSVAGPVRHVEHS